MRFIVSVAAITVAIACSAEVIHGKASYYADSLHGNLTASGEVYDKNALTAAHRTLPFGTIVKVHYPKTDRQIVVTINDRGPYAKGVIIDLSSAAAEELGMIDDGVGEVILEYVP
ncbi:MAG: septal ring lytic transglycosylase RlpA family protein [Pseudomonadota bacterium]